MSVVQVNACIKRNWYSCDREGILVRTDEARDTLRKQVGDIGLILCVTIQNIILHLSLFSRDQNIIWKQGSRVQWCMICLSWFYHYQTKTLSRSYYTISSQIPPAMFLSGVLSWGPWAGMTWKHHDSMKFDTQAFAWRYEIISNVKTRPFTTPAL